MHPRTLYALRDRGVLEPLARGLHRLAALPPLGNPDIVTVARKVPGGVVCLISALVHHDLTTQVPHAVHLALERGAERPRLDYPPLDVYWFSPAAFRAGVRETKMDGVTVRHYDAEKTIADCFKFRNRIGTDVALEALRRWRGRRDRHVDRLLHYARVDRVDRLLHYARVDRVERVLRPYLEALQ